MRPVCARVWLVSGGGIVGISPTLIVRGELNQHKVGESLTSWASFWGVVGHPPGVRPVGPTLLVLGRQWISPTLVVGGELNQYKSEESLSPLGLVFGV